MDKKHYNELSLLSQEICEAAGSRLTDYLTGTYGASSQNTMAAQLEDYLTVSEEVSAYFLGNALALLDADAREEEIGAFVENLRRIIACAQEKLERENPAD